MISSKDHSVLNWPFDLQKQIKRIRTIKIPCARWALAALLSLQIGIIPLAEAQGRRAPAKTKQSLQSPRKQVTTIIFTGLAGAVLGLSTLSFYGRPQERLSNIAVGGALGLIIGAGYTTFQAAKQLKPGYAEGGGVSFEPLSRLEDSSGFRRPLMAEPFRFRYQWQF